MTLQKCKPPTYLSDHSQIIAWVDINENLPECETNLPKPERTPLHKLPLQFDWSENSKINFRQTLKSHEIQRKLDSFSQSTFTNDEKGVNDCVTEFQNILTDAAKGSLKIRKKRTRRKINNPMNKKCFEKECRFKRHELRKLANQKHRDPMNLAIREAYHTALKTYKEILEKKRDKFHNDKLIELEKAAEENPNSFWKTLQNASDEIMNDTDKNNTPKGDDWFNHFSKLHCNHKLNEEQEKIVENLHDKEKLRYQNNTLDTEITESEITKTAMKLKLKKAAYSDKIKNEMIKSSADILKKDLPNYST